MGILKSMNLQRRFLLNYFYYSQSHPWLRFILILLFLLNHFSFPPLLFFSSLLLPRQWTFVNSLPIIFSFLFFFFFSFSQCFSANIFKFQCFFFFFFFWSHQKIAREKCSHLSTCCCKFNNFLSWVNYSCRRAKP